jgi:hypothetical protein
MLRSCVLKVSLVLRASASSISSLLAETEGLQQAIEPGRLFVAAWMLGLELVLG